jgi:ribosomal protein S21
MDEKRPAWKRDGQQGSGDRRDQRDNRDRGRRQYGSPPERKAPIVGPLEVEVFPPGGEAQVVQALKVLKNKIVKDGILAELKRRKHAEKPSEAKRRKHREALKRIRKSKGRRRSGGWGHQDQAKTGARPDSRTVAQQPGKDPTSSEDQG